MPTAPADLVDLLMLGQPPRTLILAAHADDETIGASALLCRLRDQLTIAHVTDGAPPNGQDAAAHGFASRADYAAARRRELESAVALAGIQPHQLRELNCPDQQAAFRLVELTHQLTTLLEEIQPAVLITHPYEGGHPDHDATAFIAHAAVRRLATPPTLLEMTSYHIGSAGIQPFEFLPADTPPEMTIELFPHQRRLKQAMLACFASQQETLQYFPVELERTRHAPGYDFTQPPHQGLLWYEKFDWGLDGARFRALAAEALTKLGLT